MLHVYHRKRLDSHLTELCQKMEPEKVAREMLKGNSFTISDWEEVTHPTTTTTDKNEKLVNLVQRKEINGLTNFIRSLTSIDDNHMALAEKILPVRYRVLWLSTSPAHAASVVQALEEGGNAAFSKMERIGKDKLLIIRRARVFRKEYSDSELKKTSEIVSKKMIENCHDCEVCLVFPATYRQDLAFTLEAVFRERLIQPSLVVLGKVCDLDLEGSCTKEKDGYAITKAITLENSKELKSGPNAVLPEVKDVPHIKLGIMQSKSFRKAQDTEALEGPQVVVDFDTTVLNFYTMCGEYVSDVPSLACVVPPTPSAATGPDSDAALIISRKLKEIIQLYYEDWSKRNPV